MTDVHPNQAVLGGSVLALRVAANRLTADPEVWVAIVSRAASESKPLCDAVAAWLDGLADNFLAEAGVAEQAIPDPWATAYDRSQADRGPGFRP